jgi:hypothetical protein
MALGPGGARAAAVVALGLILLVSGAASLPSAHRSAVAEIPLSTDSTSGAARPVAPEAVGPTPIGGRLFDSATGLPAGASSSASGIAVDPSDGQVFSANEYAGTVTEFDESNGTLVTSVTVAVFAEGTFPAGLALDPVHHLLFVSISTAYSGARASGWLLVLDESGLGQVANISFASAPITPFEPTYLGYDPPTNQLFVENQSWGYLAIVNLTTEWVSSYLACPVVDCAYHGYGLLDIPQFHTLVIPTCARQLWFVNTTTDATLGLVSGPPTSLMAWAAFDSADDQLWVENYTFNGPAGTFFELNISTLTIETDVPGAPPRGTDLAYDAADGVLVATNQNGSLAISTYYASNATPIASYSQGAPGNHPFFTVAIDPTTGTAIAAGLGNGTTVAFSLPSLGVDEVYPSFPSTQPAVTIDAASGTYFIAGDAPPTVRAVSESTGAILWTTLFAAGSPGSDIVALATDPAQNTVFAADAGSHQLRSLNASTGVVSFSAALPGAPTQCALLFDPTDGDLFVGTTSPSQLLQLDPSTLAVLQSLPIPGSSPCALALDPETGELLALSTTGIANVTEVDPSTLAAEATWSEGSGATGLSVNGSGIAYLVEGGLVLAVNGSTGASTPYSLAPLGTPAVSIASDNADGLIFLGLSESPEIVVASTSTATAVGSLNTSAPAGCLAFDPTSGVLIAPLASSGNVFTATLVPVPGAPATLTVLGGNDSASLNWTAPANSGPYPTLGYVVQAHVPFGSGGVPPVEVVETSAALTGLSDGVVYQISVFARSYAGVGLDPATASVTPLGVPYPPAAVFLVPVSSSSAVVEWAPPANDGGSPITGYSVEYGPVGGPRLPIVSVLNVTNLTLTGLSPSTQYSAWVTATTAIGTGHSSGLGVGTTPSAPAPATGGTNSNELLLAAGGIALAALIGVVVGRASKRGPKPPTQTAADSSAPSEPAPEKP